MAINNSLNQKSSVIYTILKIQLLKYIPEYPFNNIDDLLVMERYFISSKDDIYDIINIVSAIFSYKSYESHTIDEPKSTMLSSMFLDADENYRSLAKGLYYIEKNIESGLKVLISCNSLFDKECKEFIINYFIDNNRDDCAKLFIQSINSDDINHDLLIKLTKNVFIYYYRKIILII